MGKDRPQDAFTTNSEICVKVGESELRYMLGPPACEAAVGAESADDAGAGPPVESGDRGDAGAGESPPVVDLFWMIHNSAKARFAASSRGQLVRGEAEAYVPAGCGLFKDAALRAAAKKAGGTITIRVPYLTNREQLFKGDELWVKKQKVE